MFIEVENIRKSYGRKTIVLNGASFHAASGEYIAIVGANGCGKSTLLEILAGSLKADGGSLKIDGIDAFADAKMFQKYIGFVPQENPLMESCRQEIILNSGTVIQEETWTQTYRAVFLQC